MIFFIDFLITNLNDLLYEKHTNVDNISDCLKKTNIHNVTHLALSEGNR